MMLIREYKIYQSIVVLDLSFDCWSVGPSNIVFHFPRHQKGRINDSLGADSNMTLFDEFHSRLKSLRHFVAYHDDWQSAPAKSASVYFARYFKTLFRRNHTHCVPISIII